MADKPVLITIKLLDSELKIILDVWRQIMGARQLGIITTGKPPKGGRQRGSSNQNGRTEKPRPRKNSGNSV